MALTTIANIKETLSVGARPNLFSVSLVWPEGYELSGEMTVDTANLLCKTAAIPGMTIGVKFTVKEKIDQEKRTPEDIAKGIVKFLVDVYDEMGETVAIATILTMVKKLDQA